MITWCQLWICSKRGVGHGMTCLCVTLSHWQCWKKTVHCLGAWCHINQLYLSGILIWHLNSRGKIHQQKTPFHPLKLNKINCCQDFFQAGMDFWIWCSHHLFPIVKKTLKKNGLFRINQISCLRPHDLTCWKKSRFNCCHWISLELHSVCFLIVLAVFQTKKNVPGSSFRGA